MTTIEIIQFANAAANFVAFVGSLFFIIFLFGKSDSKVNQFPLLQHWIIKIGLCTMCAGALFSTMAYPIVVWQQLTRNVGLAMVMVWGATFHWKYFMTKPEPKKRVIKRAVKSKTAKPKKAAKKKEVNLTD